MADQGLGRSLLARARRIAARSLSALVHFLGHCWYAMLAVPPLLVVALVAVGAAAGAERLLTDVADPSALPPGLRPAVVAPVATVLAGGPAAALAFRELDGYVYDRFGSLFDRSLPGWALAVPPLVALGLAWSLPARGIWGPVPTLAVALVHLAVALQCLEYVGRPGPFAVGARVRHALLGLVGLPTALLLAVLLVVVGGAAPEYAAALETGRLAADGPVLALGPVTAGAWLLGGLATPPVVAATAGLARLAATARAGPGGGTTGADGAAGLAGDRKYADDEAERAHRAAMDRDPPVEEGEVVTLTLEEAEYRPNGLTIRGRVEGFHVFVDEDVPDDLEKHDRIRAKVLYFNRGGTSATAAFIGYA